MQRYNSYSYEMSALKSNKMAGYYTYIYMKCKCNFTISIIYLIYILYNHVLGFIFFNAISRYQTTAEKRFTMRQVSCYEALKLFIMMSCMNGIAHAAFITCIMC